MKIRIEYRDLAIMGASAEQLDTYSNTDPLDIYQTGDDEYTVSGAVEATTTAAGLLDLLTALADPDC